MTTRVSPELIGLSLDELRIALQQGLDLGPGADEDLEDLMTCEDALRRLPARGYEALLDAFGDARRRELDPADVVRQWHAGYGGFLIRRDGALLLHLPLGQGNWALCDGARLWRLKGNPFA